MTKAKTIPSDADTTPVSYEASLKKLEGLVQQMESGQLPLADLLSGYQRGAELLGYCRAQLDAVEQQIKVLDNGALKTWTPT
jgi:exodeoxyribonuclease VII small subunit